MYGDIFPSAAAIIAILVFAGFGVWKLIEILMWFFSHLAWV